MPSHVETLLTSFGIPAEDAATIVSLPAEEAAKFDVTPYADKVKNNYQTQFKNDPEFFSDITFDNLAPEVKKKFESSQYARAANITKSKLVKALGMTEADYADLTDEQKEKLDLFVPAIAERYGKSKAGDKQLQQDLIEARKQLENYEGFEEKIKAKYEGETEQKITDVISNASILSELSGLQGLKVKASTLAREAKEILNAKYAIVRVGDFGVELRQKSNPQMKVLKPNSSHELTLKEALAEIAEGEAWVEPQEKDKQSGSGKVTVTPTNNGLKAVVAPHIADKISNKIKASKTA